MLDLRNSPPVKVRSPKQDRADGVHISHVGGSFGAVDSVIQGNERCLNHKATCFGGGPIRDNYLGGVKCVVIVAMSCHCSTLQGAPTSYSCCMVVHPHRNIL